MTIKCKAGLFASWGLFICAAVAAPQVPILSVAVSNGDARVQWQGEGGVNYELQSSPDAFFRINSLKFFMGNGAALSEAAVLSRQTSGFWRVRAYTNSAGIGVATSGVYAGKLIHYDSNGTAVPLRAFGVDYYDAFLRYLRDTNDTTFIQGFQYLRAHDIPAARVPVAYSPNDWDLYFTNKTEFYRRLDYFISQAEQHDVGLILDCFWRVVSVGEIVNKAVTSGYLVPGTDFTPPDPLNTDINTNATYAEYKRALGRPDSGSNAFITYFTREIVTRYAGSPAIWGWEFGNEYNNGVDHPSLSGIRTCHTPVSGDMLPDTTTNLTILPEWTGPDDLTHDDVQTAKQNFANTVRSIDTWRLILSGDARPRTSAYHNWTEHKFTKDSRAQLAVMLPIDNPAPVNTVTIHFYPSQPTDTKDEVYFTDSPLTNAWMTGQYVELMDYFATNSALIGRPLVVGEWGGIGDGTTEDEKTTFNRLMQALIDSGVQLSMMWNFDSRQSAASNTWWIQTGMVSGYPASPKLYQITNDDPDLWDLEQANRTYGSW
ncbi:MAG: cellulase family glycosylhydrolase [Kiritimatiellales bacterium]|jgi:hypothetical protein